MKKRKIPRYSCRITNEEIAALDAYDEIVAEEYIQEGEKIHWLGEETMIVMKTDPKQQISGEELFQKEMQEKFANSNPRRDEDED